MPGHVRQVVLAAQAELAVRRRRAGQEVGDIVLYLLLFCGETGLDLEQVVRAKLADCERRFLP